MNTGTTNNLYAFSAYNNQYAYAVGANGTLLKTSGQAGANFGTNWASITLGTSNDFRNMIMHNLFLTYREYIFGNNGSIFSTSNYGANWITENSGVNVNLYSGATLNDTTISANKIFIVGNNGTILLKYDSVNYTPWYQINSGTTNNLKSIYFNISTGWITGVNGTLLKSTNLGVNWFSVNTGINNELNSICFQDSSTGFIGGSGGIILKTTNKGTNWFTVQSGTTQTLNNISQYRKYVGGNYVYTQWIVGNNGTVLTSTNNGVNWVSENYVPQVNLNSGQYIYNNFWVVGDNGKIYKRNLDTVYHTNEYVKLDGNNINSFFINKGIFNQDIRTTNTPGFEWPKGNGRYAIFTSGLNIAAKVNGELREAMASYKGEYGPGYCVNGIFYSNLYFKIYKVSKNENTQTSWDWANWGQMVPYGAPYIDVNNNGIYEPAIDTPGVRNANQTIFYCMTDADYNTHDPGEGFGGGTQPLGAEVHMTAWAYDAPGLQDVQFISYEIINKSTNTWNATQIAIVCDPDLGDANDDYVGCDTVLKLGFCYNGDNNDNIYGANPPAVGMTLLISPLNRMVTPNRRLGMTSFNTFIGTGASPPPCESDPNGEPPQAYQMLCGFKKDSTCNLDPTQVPPKKTKFCYPGDPETNVGWTEAKGSIGNCGRDSTGVIYSPNSPSDKRYIMSSGANNFSIAPGESQKFVIAQMIARGSSNLNSVTVLKNLCTNVRAFYEQNFPIGINQVSTEIPREFKLMQNYPNPFNPTTNIKYKIAKSGLVTIKVYNILGKEIQTLVNEKQETGTYEVTFYGNNLASGIYFYKLQAGDFTQTRKMLMIK
jgi:photosystem II stability/assembly factor-like uncharacterized protein